MGNCCVSDEAKTREEPMLRELTYLDRQHNNTAARNGPLHAEGPTGNGRPGLVRPGYGMPPAYVYPSGYGGYPTVGYPADHTGLYYQPPGPMLVLDPYGSYAYEIDSEAYDMYVDGERRHHKRRKDRDRGKSKYDDEDSDHEGKGDKKKHGHHRESGKISPRQQNGGPPTSNSTNRSPTTRGANARTSHIVRTATSSAAQPRHKPDYVPHDVMISYNRADHAVMVKIKDAVEAAGLTVWVDKVDKSARGGLPSITGEAIIDAKLFVCILSEQAVKSKSCRDEVALAYVSNTAIFPVNLVPKDQLMAVMDTRLKLQLAGYKWTPLEDTQYVEENTRELVATMKAEMDKVGREQERIAVNSLEQAMSAADGGGVASPEAVDVGIGGDAGGSSNSPPQSPRSDSDVNPLSLRLVNRVNTVDEKDGVSHVMSEQFWSDRFGTSDHVEWDRFTAGFLEEFREPVHQTFIAEDRQQLLDILRREMEVDDDNRLFKYQFMTFCTQQGEATPVWQRVQDQARESFAMREVFSVDSSVRVEAIENFGKFRSAAVIDALRDLLTDPDANVRAVATVSLARTDANDPVTVRHIMRMLSDKDRLVREAGCLALGHLKARQAVSKLTHIWRNDVISCVREAAAAALRQIGGQEVEEVMRITKVLAEEIRTLSEME